MILNDDWQQILKNYFASEKHAEFAKRVNDEYRKYKCCPRADRIFYAFNECAADNVKVVILGQDPYFNENQATGMAFSIDPTIKGLKFPPTLRNIIKEVADCFGECSVSDGNLTPWAKQGVLLLNTCLSVRQGAPLSHSKLGWENFIHAVIAYLDTLENIVFVLWGSHAQGYREYLKNSKNLILTSSHPSPLSAHMGFLGCRHFVKINDFLVNQGKKEITW